MHFTKYHGLGNDYLVMVPADVGRDLTLSEIRLICHRNYGPGSDGILWGPLRSASGDFSLRISTRMAVRPKRAAMGFVFCAVFV